MRVRPIVDCPLVLTTFMPSIEDLPFVRVEGLEITAIDFQEVVDGLGLHDLTLRGQNPCPPKVLYQVAHITNGDDISKALNVSGVVVLPDFMRYPRGSPTDCALARILLEYLLSERAPL